LERTAQCCAVHLRTNGPIISRSSAFAHFKPVLGRDGAPGATLAIYGDRTVDARVPATYGRAGVALVDVRRKQTMSGEHNGRRNWCDRPDWSVLAPFIPCRSHLAISSEETSFFIKSPCMLSIFCVAANERKLVAGKCSRRIYRNDRPRTITARAGLFQR